jgi:hypothetical protein
VGNDARSLRRELVLLFAVHSHPLPRHCGTSTPCRMNNQSRETHCPLTSAPLRPPPPFSEIEDTWRSRRPPHPTHLYFPMSCASIIYHIPSLIRLVASQPQTPFIPNELNFLLYPIHYLLLSSPKCRAFLLLSRGLRISICLRR